MSPSKLEKRLLDFFQQHPGAAFRTRDLFQDLQIESVREHEQVHDILNTWVLKGIVHRQGKLHTYRANHLKGTLSLNKSGDGFVAVEGYDEDFFISPSRLRTGMHGDTVIIVPVERRRQTGKRIEAEVLSVVERASTQIVGTFESKRNTCTVVPDDKRIRRDIYVDPDRTAGAKDGQKVVVRLDGWEDEFKSPEGTIVEILGFPNEKGVDVLSVVKAHDIHWEFPAAVEKESAGHPARIPEQVIAKRLDLRGHMTVTIDPFDAKDFDDAVSLETLKNGHVILGVHIADVSYYINEGGSTDREAFKRGTSTYLVDRVIPMLPERLSNNLCSLVPNQDRLTYSVLVELDDHANVVEYDIAETVIHSKRRFTYEEVQEIIDGATTDDDEHVLASVRQMQVLAAKLTKNRFKNGSIDFDTPETKFRLDDKGRPVECYRKERLQSHRLVEEFMLLANQITAKHLALGKQKLPFLYRIHDKPVHEKLEKFLHLLAVLGHKVTIPKTREKIRPQHIQKIIESVKGKKEDLLVEKVAIRAMAKAEYSPKNIGHFGLAFEYYTHFTSPIRRYPDLIVHRLLKEYAAGMSTARVADWNDRLTDIGRHCSSRERIATEAERDSVKVKQVEFMQDHIGVTYQGTISGVTAFGLFIEIAEYLIEGFVAVRNMEDDYYIFDEKRYHLMGKRRRKVYRLGDTVTIRVVRANREKHELDFELTE